MVRGELGRQGIGYSLLMLVAPSRHPDGDDSVAVTAAFTTFTLLGVHPSGEKLSGDGDSPILLIASPS